MFGDRIEDLDADLSRDQRDSAPFAPLAAVAEGASTWGDVRPPQASPGANTKGGGVRFRVWAPVASRGDLVLENGTNRVLALQAPSVEGTGRQLIAGFQCPGALVPRKLTPSVQS